MEVWHMVRFCNAKTDADALLHEVTWPITHGPSCAILCNNSMQKGVRGVRVWAPSRNVPCHAAVAGLLHASAEATPHARNGPIRTARRRCDGPSAWSIS